MLNFSQANEPDVHISILVSGTVTSNTFIIGTAYTVWKYVHGMANPQIEDG